MALSDDFTHINRTDDFAMAEAMAKKYNQEILPGHGVFFDHSQAPEYGKLLIECLVNKYGWILERPYFIRNGPDIDD